MKLTLIDLIFPMKPSDFKIYFQIISYDKEIAEKWLILLRCRKARCFQTIKDINLNF